MREKKYSKILTRIHKGEAFNKLQVSFNDIKDPKVRNHLMREKYVTKDIIGRYSLTLKGKQYIGLEKHTPRIAPITLKRLKFIKNNPDLTSRELRNKFNMDSAQFSQFAIRYNLQRIGKFGSYKYQIANKTSHSHRQPNLSKRKETNKNE